MSKREKISIVTLIIIIILVIFIIILVKNGKTENKLENETENQIKEQYVNEIQNGSKINTSDKLKQTKKIDGIEISNIKIIEQEGTTKILADMKNTTNETKGGFDAEVTILDNTKNKVIVLGAYIQQLEPGQEEILRLYGTADFANAYDFTITKK